MCGKKGGREAGWGKWKFCHREAERVLEEKKGKGLLPLLRWVAVSWGLIIWGSGSFFSEGLTCGAFVRLRLNVSSEVLHLLCQESPGITTGLGALFMFVSPCGGS